MELSKPPFFVQLFGCRIPDDSFKTIRIEGFDEPQDFWPEKIQLNGFWYDLEGLDESDSDNEIADYRRSFPIE